MEYRQLGRAGVRVSPVAVGTANFGWVTDEGGAHDILSAAYDRGVNFIDTAASYNAGGSEEIIAGWLRKTGHRDQIVLATKVYDPPKRYASGDPRERTAATRGPNEYGLSARHIKLECEASLRRLGVDHIDLYQLHHLDRCTPMDEIWQAMETLVAQGKIIYVGTSNCAGWHLARSCETAAARQMLGPVSQQGPYNLLRRTVELDLLPACEGYGVGFLPYSPLAGGLLAGTRDAGQRRSVAREKASPGTVEKVRRFEALCAELGHEPEMVATAWLLTRAGVTAVLLGPRTVEHLEEGLGALDITLRSDTLRSLDEIFPGPGGPAPEAYAW